LGGSSCHKHETIIKKPNPALRNPTRPKTHQIKWSKEKSLNSRALLADNTDIPTKPLKSPALLLKSPGRMGVLGHALASLARKFFWHCSMLSTLNKFSLLC
jgi:hypothetical protein